MPASRQVLQCIVLFTNDDALELESRVVITFIRENVGFNLLRMKIKQHEEIINVTHKNLFSTRFVETYTRSLCIYFERLELWFVLKYKKDLLTNKSYTKIIMPQVNLYNLNIAKLIFIPINTIYIYRVFSIKMCKIIITYYKSQIFTKPGLTIIILSTYMNRIQSLIPNSNKKIRIFKMTILVPKTM